MSGISNVATDRILLGLAHNLANRKENEEEGTPAAADIIEEVVRACKKPVSVKDYMGLTQALTMVAAAAPHHHPNLTPDDSSTNSITTTTAVTSKSADDTPPRANTPDVVEVESNKETTTATSCDTTPSPVLISPAPGSTTTTINNTTTNNKVAAIRGLGKLKLSSDMMISSFENVSSTNVHDEYADGTVDFVNSVYGPDKSIVQLVEIGPVSIQWGETYRLYGVSESDGIHDVLQAGTHMWDKCAHILELVEEDVKIKEETSSKKQECKAVDEMDMDEISKAIADEKAEKAAEVKKRIEEQAKKEPVFERVLLRGWVWNQFSFCLHRGAAFVILFCFRDYSLSGHNVNMRLALLSPEIGPLREEIRRFVF